MNGNHTHHTHWEFALVVAFAIMTSFFLRANIADAVIKSFGGRVVTTHTPPIVCPGVGYITIVPVGVSAPGPYFIAPGIPVGYGKLRPGAPILGRSTMFTTLGPCFLPTPDGPVPVPNIIIPYYGTSKF